MLLSSLRGVPECHSNLCLRFFCCMLLMLYGLQGEEGQWVALEQLREKLMARVGDRPLVELVLSTAPNKLTCKGAVSRHGPLNNLSDLSLVLCGSI